jgi:opacity protein-like surface antigen
MKKWFLILVAVLGFSSLAGAQKFSVGGGLTSQFQNGFVLGFGLNLGVENLVKFSKDFGLDARVDLEGSFSSGGFIFGLGAGVYASYQISDIDIYFGPRIILLLSPSTAFGFGALLGVHYDLSNSLALYSEIRFLFVPGFDYQAALGLRILV